MSTKVHPGSSEPDCSLNAGDMTVNGERKETKHSPKEKQHTADAPANGALTKGDKDKGVQYLVLSMVGYVCASIVFGFLLHKNRKEGNV